MRSAKILNLPDKLGAAIAVCLGEYGEDPERRERLKNDGYDPTEIQKMVNDLFPALEPYLTIE